MDDPRPDSPRNHRLSTWRRKPRASNKARNIGVILLGAAVAVIAGFILYRK